MERPVQPDPVVEETSLPPPLPIASPLYPEDAAMTELQSLMATWQSSKSKSVQEEHAAQSAVNEFIIAAPLPLADRLRHAWNVERRKI